MLVDKKYFGNLGFDKLLECEKKITVYNSILTELRLKNYGAHTSVGNLELQYLKVLDYDSAKYLLDNLYDRATAGYSTLTITFSAATYATLSDDEITAAAELGYTIASA